MHGKNESDYIIENIKIGVEDKIHYVINDSCVMCGACARQCPAKAIIKGEKQYYINSKECIDCGTCSAVCPTGAAKPSPYMRNSISLQDIDIEKCYFNPGCAMNLYKPEISQKMLELLHKNFGNVKPHNICCRHEPDIKEGTIINNCAGCDRRFRSLYKNVNTVSYWEIIDSIPDLNLPNYEGLKASVHDSCGYRHKPQVHKAIRNILQKMNIKIIESEFSGTKSVCCGDNFYGCVSNEMVEKRIKFRADQLPCQNVIVYCIGCVRAMTSAGKTPYYLPDLLFNHITEPITDTLDEYHSKLVKYIDVH